MTYEQFNLFCKSLTATTNMMQWGAAHVWKAGGKVFAINCETNEPVDQGICTSMLAVTTKKLWVTFCRADYLEVLQMYYFLTEN